MNSKILNAYADFRRGIFDPKGDLDPIKPTFSTEQLTKAAGAVGRVVELTPLPGGSFNSSFRFETPDGSYVLRVPVDERFAPSLPVEEWAANAAREVRFSTIVPIITDISHYLAPFSFQIFPFLEGVSEELRLGWMARLHGVFLGGYGPIDPRSLSYRPHGLFDTWEGYLTTRLDEHLAKCVDIGAMTAAEAELADDIIREKRSDTFDPVLIHNDLSPRNVIENRVIDWDSCIAGDPLWELAGFCAFRSHMPVGPLLAAYHVKGADVPRIFWTYYLRIVLARTVHRHRFNIPENPKYPGASRRIQMALSELS